MRDAEASATAQRVAAQRLTFERAVVGYGRAEDDDRLAADVAGEVSGEPGGLTRYLAGRTRFFDRVVVSALASEVGQVVIAAAGYDGRALRYAKPGVRWFEVDHPSTQADKRVRLDRLNIDTDHITFVPADFTRDSVVGKLLEHGVNSSVRTLVLCEGVAVYLEPPVLAGLLRGLRAAVAEQSRLAISLSVSELSAEISAKRAAFEAAVAALGEPARSRLTADQATELLTGAGWSIEPSTSQRSRSAGFVSAVALGE